MNRRLSRHGWYVLVSIPADDGGQCVDIFSEPRNGFGFQQFRTDAEDQGAWTLVGAGERGYESATVAAAVAVAAVPWLTEHPAAKRHLEDWLATLS